LLMLKHGFISATANVNQLAEESEGVPVITGDAVEKELNTVMSNSFGFGGTNATLVFRNINV